MTTILSKAKDYIEKHVPIFEEDGKMFTCYKCRVSPASCTLDKNNNLRCAACGFMGSIIECIKVVEKITDEIEIVQNIKESLDLDIITEKDILNAFDRYSLYGFDMCRVARNQKIPLEKDWGNKVYKDSSEWLRWIKEGLNIGVKTGKRSGITIIDIDTKPIPEEIQKLLGNGIIVETTKGHHVIYKYCEELSKSWFDFKGFHIDIENDGGQVVIFPSIVDGIQRNPIEFKDILLPEVPTELKALIKVYSSASKKTSSELGSEVLSTISEEDLALIPEGSRHLFLVHLGGILRKELNTNQVSYVLKLINSKFCKPRMPEIEIDKIIRGLGNYITDDEKLLSSKILEYLKITGDAIVKDIELAVLGNYAKGEEKKRIEKALFFLIKEGFVYKKRNSFFMIKKADWKDTFVDFDNEVSFKMPYFHDVAVFNYGDMILLGSQSKAGKTTVAINILKRFIEQGIKPYYIGLEAGSRFIKTAIRLGLKETDFFWDFIPDPTKIELEPNGITILDWLCIEDKSGTDTVFKHFAEQLFKTKGVLIVFNQLKKDNGWFAPNMIEFFPSMCAKYIYDEESNGETVKWIVEPIREPKGRKKTTIIPCKYDYDSRELKRIDELI
jgi:transcription elongation factor Elf1